MVQNFVLGLVSEWFRVCSVLVADLTTSIVWAWMASSSGIHGRPDTVGLWVMIFVVDQIFAMFSIPDTFEADVRSTMHTNCNVSSTMA